MSETQTRTAVEKNRQRALRTAAVAVFVEHQPGSPIDATIRRILAEEDWTRFGWKPTLADVLGELIRMCIARDDAPEMPPHRAAKVASAERLAAHLRALVEEEGVTPKELIQIGVWLDRGTGAT